MYALARAPTCTFTSSVRRGVHILVPRVAGSGQVLYREGTKWFPLVTP
jgi:hypothetical protein